MIGMPLVLACDTGRRRGFVEGSTKFGRGPLSPSWVKVWAGAGDLTEMRMSVQLPRRNGRSKERRESGLQPWGHPRFLRSNERVMTRSHAGTAGEVGGKLESWKQRQEHFKESHTTERTSKMGVERGP